MGDVEDREVHAVLEVLEQVEHPEPDRDVQHRDGLVGEEDLGVGAERAGDGHALALTSRQLVRELVQVLMRRSQLDAVQQSGQVLFQFRLAAARPAVDLQCPGEVVAHGVHGVQRGERVLEDELDPAYVTAEGPATSGLHRLPAQVDLALGERIQLGEQSGDGGLPGARLPHQCRDGAAPQFQRDVVDGVDGTALAREEIAAGAPYGEVFGDSACFEHDLVLFELFRHGRYLDPWV